MGESTKKWPFLILIIGLLILMGCNAPEEEPEQGTGEAPAVTVQPPPTPRVTPSPGAARPTPTEEPEPTDEIAAAPSATPTATATPTEEREPTNEATAEADAPTARPTSRPPTATPRPTATPTPTPSPTQTPGAMVDYFQANVQEADPGELITLEWATRGADIITLWRIMATGQFGQFWDVAEAGTFEFQIPEHERNLTRFALAVTDAGGKTDMVTLEIPLRCPDTWFFGNPPDICPAGPALVSAGAEQHFQGGVMLWVGGEDRIYVLYGDGQSPQWAAFTDEWDAGEPESDPTLEPPPGFYQPARGFGQAWREQPGVRQRLGWALADEVAYQTALQRTSYGKYNETYIRAADGNVWRLKAERSGWEKR